MDEPPKLKPSRTIRIGPDHVTITDQEVFIEARHELPDWQVRQFKVIPIYFEDKKYFLAEKRRVQPPYAFCYVLSPWPESHIESATFCYTYDAQAVAERDESHRSGQCDELLRLSLLPLYPFLGFIWSGAQRKLIRFGFAPQSLTAASIFTGFSLILLQGAFTAVMINVSARAGNLMLGGMIRAFAGQDHFHFGPISIPVALLDSLLLLAFLADVPVRYSKHLREQEWAGGFLEWMVPQSWRRS
jgi:hypothetical protein